MQNLFIQKLQFLIGKPITESPSALAIWLQLIPKIINEGEVEVDVIVREDMTNPVKALHGGVIAAIIDETVGMAVFTLNKTHFYTTVSLHTNFLSGASIGETITAKAKIVRNGKNIINTECSIYNASNKLLATGTTNLLVTQIAIPQ